MTASQTAVQLLNTTVVASGGPFTLPALSPGGFTVDPARRGRPPPGFACCRWSDDRREELESALWATVHAASARRSQPRHPCGSVTGIGEECPMSDEVS